MKPKNINNQYYQSAILCSKRQNFLFVIIIISSCSSLYKLEPK